jgi:hypothetical protein
MPHASVERDECPNAVQSGFAAGVELEFAVQNVDGDRACGLMLMQCAAWTEPHERQPQWAFLHKRPRDSRVARGKLVAYNLHFLAEIERENVAGKGSVHRGHERITSWARGM